MPDTTTLRLSAAAERWPLARPFVISRGAKTEAHVVVATVSDGTHTGRGECVPYARYGESVEGVLEAILSAAPLSTRARLQETMPPGAARNAIDCALWDLEAKQARSTVAALIGQPQPKPLPTCYTLSLGSPDEMARAAQSVPHLSLLKLKLGGEGDIERMRAVRRARPEARLLADANEAWTASMLAPCLAAAAEAGFELIEQPLPASGDMALSSLVRPVPVCADESAHTADGIAALCGRYDAVNIKLDKTGGLTGALAMQHAARQAGLKIMAGCMVATSLAMAPAFLLAQDAEWVDLDGPLLLKADRTPGLAIVDGVIRTPPPGLWG